MNNYQQKLYDDLLSLAESNEAFFYKDFTRGEKIYRIFNYRLASYMDFLEPSAMECRGIMFEVDQDNNAIRLASLPMEKFFNLNENPMTMELDLSVIDDIELKADGSLISTYMHGGELCLKTKGSLESDQAIAAMKWLNDNEVLYQALYHLTELGHTINMEWCAPDNRIVISYSEPHLTVLNIRSHSSGKYVSKDELREELPALKKILQVWVAKFTIDMSYDSYTDFVAAIPDMEGIEGYVIRLPSGQRVKIKTEWYLVQHRAKDSINSPRRLFEACIEGATDDLRSLFHTDPIVIGMIEEMEKFAEGVYNHTVDSIERFYERNKGLERKEYAILGQKELDKKIFGLAMSKYLGRGVDYKHFMRKNYKSFGVADDPVDVVE